MKLIKLCLPFLLFPLHSMAIYELDAEFSYDKSLYGAERQNKQTTRTYYASFASYFFTNTAIEFNYSESDNSNIVNEELKLTGTDFTQTSQESMIQSKSYGVGIRQAFANKKAFLVPTLSIGYAKRFTTYQNTYTYRDDTDGSSLYIPSEVMKTREDSIFGTFSLKLQVTKFLALKGSVRTLFPADDFNQAKDYLKYTAGFTWTFI